MQAELEARTMSKVTWRLVPLLALLYFVSYIDRTNLAFAGLTMKQDLGFSAQVFGLGGSFFFVGYLALQIPGSMAINRFGARHIMMVMTFAWGVFATGMALVGSETSFYVMRALLGAAESAFFPGTIYYISLWFPAAYRTRMIALFMVANPLSGMVGLPLSAALMKLDGVLGLTGWQWVFVGEGLPAVVLAAVALRYLTNVPAEADWLAPDERAWLVNAMTQDTASRRHSAERGVASAMFSRASIMLCIGYFGVIMGIYGLNLWLPQLVREFGFSITQTGFIAATPYAAASLAMLIWGLRSSGKGAKAEHAAIAALLSCIGLVFSATGDTALVSMLALSVAAVGLYIALPAFWTIPTAMFSGAGGAAVIALISTVGHLGGFAGPYVMGLFRDLYDSFAFGLAGLAMALLVSAAVAWNHRGAAGKRGDATAPASSSHRA